MGVSDRLRRFAFATPTAFPVVGWGGERPWLELLRSGLVEPARAPHDSDLLLLSGRIPASWSGPLRALFETLALPRLVLWLRPDQDAPRPEGLPLVELDPQRPDCGAVLDRLLDRGAPNNRPVLPDEPPSPWRGEGDHGQGGEGMMGGKPYGRPMAMVGNDRDGLMLGALPTSLGPFFPGLPSGLQVKLSVQGERVSSVDGVTNWFPEGAAGEAAPAALRAARGTPVPAADLERARIRSHLRTMAAVLGLAGLDAMAHRFLSTETSDRRRLQRLFRSAQWRGLRRVLEGVGRVGRDQVQKIGLVGPPARAAGLGEDARASDPAYRGAGFAPVTAQGGDAWARWSVLRDECLQSAALLPRLGERSTRAAEGPHGPWLINAEGVRGASRANLPVLEQVLPGLLWPEALLTIASLALDMREAAIR
jgi:hypothetical protein